MVISFLKSITQIKQGVIMKQLIILLLIILVTVMSWSSCAKNTVINAVSMYTLTYPVANFLLLTPTLTTLNATESLSFSQTKVVNGHNRFFEFSIVFNENLQQAISFFTHTDNESSDVLDNSFPSYTGSQSTIKICNTNS
jgi:hypothetical protein